MSHSLYIASAEPRSGKVVVLLGIMEFLSRHSRKIGFFRPVIRSLDVPDSAIELVCSRYGLQFPYETMYGIAYDDALELMSTGGYDDLLKDILNKYKALEDQTDTILCLGTDFTGVASALEFDFNADAANNLGSLMIPVVNGRDRSEEQIGDAATAIMESLEDRGCDVLALVVNRVSSERIAAVKSHLSGLAKGDVPAYVVPENEQLAKPTVRAIAKALNAIRINGDEESFNNEVRQCKVAAMRLPNFLDHVEEGDLIIAPADRSDIVVGSLLAHVSNTYPHLAGLMLTGNLSIAPQVAKLIEGLITSSLPICSVATDTFSTAVAVDDVPAAIEPENSRKIAAALGIIEEHVDFSELGKRLRVERPHRVTPLMFEYKLIQQAKSDRMHVVLPEGEEERVLKAAEILLLRDVVEITLLGDVDRIEQKIKNLGLSLDAVQMVDPATSSLREEFARQYYEIRKHKGISEDVAYDAMADVSYFGTMMVYGGKVDALVSGSVHTTQDTIRPAFHIIGVRSGSSIASSVFFMCMPDRVLVFGDCAVNPDPNPAQLAEIAVSSADTASLFGIEPRVAMLSYSTGESGKGVDVEKVGQATRLARERRPDLEIEGPIQYDAAVDPTVARIKMPESKVAGRATVFVFPDLNNGNITYKAVQRSAHAIAIGPVIQGLKKPVNDLSRGATVPDIVNTIAITAIQAQSAASEAQRGVD
ncbi:MAG: phosphate acetyltransferase [Deltaproteobacteria bacterium]